MMKNSPYLLASGLLFILAGCTNIEDSLSKEDAKRLVIEEHTNQNGRPSIVSIQQKHNKYIVKWEKRENKERGTDRVYQDGEVETIKAEIE